MLTVLLSNWRVILLALLLGALAVQTGRISLLKSEYAKEKAERTAQEATERARIAQNSTEALDALQSRYAALESRYRVLRSKPAAPSLVEATGILQTCPGESGKPNPAVGQVERLEAGIERLVEFGDREISKYVELWELQQRNSVPNSSP